MEKRIRAGRLRQVVLRTLAALISIGLISCSFGIDFSPKDQTFYTIVEQSDETKSPAKRVPIDLVVRETRATPFLSGKKIVFGASPQTRGYYQFAAWVEPLPKRFSALLVRSLQTSGLFRSVAKSTLSAHGDVELVTELVDCYHLTNKNPGSVEITLDADLLQIRTGVVVAHRRFTKHVPSPTYDADGAVNAIQEGLYAIIDELSEWILSTATPG